MSMIELVLKQPWVVRAGWTLVHFLWQGLLLALLFVIVRAFLSRSLGARGRYLLACLTMTLLAITPALTFAALQLGVSELPAPIWKVPADAWNRALPWLVLGWMAGAIFFSVRLVGGWRLTRRLRTVATAAVPVEWTHTLLELVDRMRIGHPVRLLASSLVSSPMVIGWLRPVVLMPVECVLGLPIGQVRALLAHELAHVRRHDYLVNILQSVVEALLFYHPAVWWISEQIRAEREACCDDLAVEMSGNVLLYVQALADLESRRRAQLQLVLAADGGSLLHRVRRLTVPPRADGSRPAPGAAWVLAFLWLAGIGAVTMQASPAHSAPKRAFHLPAAQARVAPAPLLLDPAPEIHGPSTVVTALLFDPFFATPQAPAPQTATPTVPATPPAEKVKLQGRVLSAAQAPLKKASVRLEANGGNGGPSAYIETTDDAGKFSIEGIEPGEYLLSATKTGFTAGRYGARTAGGPGAPITLKPGAEVKNLEIALIPQAKIRGRVVDSDGEPIPKAALHLHRVTYTDGVKKIEQVRIGQTETTVRGYYIYENVPPGRYYLSASVNDSTPADDGTEELTTFYPSVLDAESAVPLDVAAGASVEGIDVKVRREKFFKASGRVIANGAPVDTMSLAIAKAGDPPGVFKNDVAMQGKFLLRRLVPGTYRVQPSLARRAAGQDLSAMSGGIEFTIKDRDLEGLVLNLASSIEIKGSFEIEGGDFSAIYSQDSHPPLPKVTLQGADPWNEVGQMLSFTDPTGAFHAGPMPASQYRLDVQSPPPGTYIKYVRYGTRDVTDAPFTVSNGDEPLKIVFSPNAGAIQGTVRDSNGMPMPGVRVTMWSKSVNPGRSGSGVRSAYSDQNGAFQFQGLAPAEYYVAAWEQIDEGLDRNRELLGYLTGKASAVKVSEKSQNNIDVKTISRDDLAREAAKVH